jgi:hypothetical protein
MGHTGIPILDFRQRWIPTTRPQETRLLMSIFALVRLGGIQSRKIPAPHFAHIDDMVVDARVDRSTSTLRYGARTTIPALR